MDAISGRKALRCGAFRVTTFVSHNDEGPRKPGPFVSYIVMEASTSTVEAHKNVIPLAHERVISWLTKMSMAC